MTKKDYNKWAKMLKPYWKKREELMSAFRKNEVALGRLMNQELDPPVELEFFYNDDGCCGIGAVEYVNKDKFTLIHNSDLVSTTYKLHKKPKNGYNKWVF